MFSNQYGCETVLFGTINHIVKANGVYDDMDDMDIIFSIFPCLYVIDQGGSPDVSVCVWSVSGSISCRRSWCHCYLGILGVPATRTMMHTIECKIYSNNITNQPAHLPVNNIINDITSILTKYSANIHTNFCQCPFIFHQNLRYKPCVPKI